jgi:hypothetical protein
MKKKRKVTSRVRQVMEEQGKDEKWFAAELKRVFGVNKSLFKKIIDGGLGMSVVHYAYPVSFVLKVPVDYLLKN